VGAMVTTDLQASPQQPPLSSASTSAAAAGPLELLLRAEAEQRKGLRARTLDRALRCGGRPPSAGLASPCRSSPGGVQHSGDGRRSNGFMEPTWLSAFRKMEVVDRDKLDEAEVAVLGIADAVNSDGGSTRIGSPDVGSATMSEAVGTTSTSCGDGMTTSVAFEEFYRRNETFVEEREQFLDILRRQKEESDFQECTFEPNLSSTAKSTPQASPKRPTSATRRSEELYRRGVEQQAKKEERMQKMRQQKADEEVAECSFKPSSRRRPSLPRAPPPPRPKADSAAPQRGGGSITSAKGGPSRTSYAAAAAERLKASEQGPVHSSTTPQTTPAQQGSSGVARPQPPVVRQSAATGQHAFVHQEPSRVRHMPPSCSNSLVQPLVRGASVAKAIDKMEGMLKGLQAC